MKKIIKTLALGFVLLALTGCTNTNKDISSISYNPLDNCNYKPKLLTTHNDLNVYTYCLNEVKVEVNEKEIELESYLKDNNDSIDKIINILSLKDVIYDGGTKIYKGNDITLIKCNTLDGNKDIYIGDYTMKYKANFCKDNNYTFIKTYKINGIEEYNKQQYEDDIPVTYGNSFMVKLEALDKQESVIINNLWDTKLIEGKTYEFEFMLYPDAVNIVDSAEYIFKNAILVEVRETTKEVDKQIQEKAK